jgi:hypothetical protein
VVTLLAGSPAATPWLAELKLPSFQDERQPVCEGVPPLRDGEVRVHGGAHAPSLKSRSTTPAAQQRARAHQAALRDASSLVHLVHLVQVRFGGMILHPLLADVLEACQASWAAWAERKVRRAGGATGRRKMAWASQLELCDAIWLEEDRERVSRAGDSEGGWW